MRRKGREFTGKRRRLLNAFSKTADTSVWKTDQRHVSLLFMTVSAREGLGVK